MQLWAVARNAEVDPGRQAPVIVPGPGAGLLSQRGGEKRREVFHLR